MPFFSAQTGYLGLSHCISYIIIRFKYKYWVQIDNVIII